MFPKGTSLNDNAGETGAKPEIWQDWPKFLAAADTLGKLSFELALTAGKGDKGAIGGAMKTFGKVGCGGCHRSIRKKLKK